MNQLLESPFGLAPRPLPVKREIFISSFHADRREVDEFIYRWATVENVFTAKALATFENEDFINSNNPEYVMCEIRRKYLMDSSVTILLVGKCTHSRRYVDWELKSSLRRGQNVPNGLLAFVLPSAMPPAYGLYGPLQWHERAWPAIPDRLAANWNYFGQANSYARYWVMPNSAGELRQHIEYAAWSRINRGDLIQNDRLMMQNNGKCRACGVWH